MKIDEWGGKRKGVGRKKRGFYKPFSKARLSDGIQGWLVQENGKYTSWETFFQELKKRYERHD